jgi:hypothetical protein
MKYELNRVKSSNLKAIGYNKELKELYVLFNNNGFYKYNPVEELVYKYFIEVQSKGKYFASSIKTNKTYKCEKLTVKSEDLDFGETVK